MHRQLSIPVAHRADGNVVTHSTPDVAVELPIDERIEVAPVAEMVQVHHAGGNPMSTQMLPAE